MCRHSFPVVSLRHARSDTPVDGVPAAVWPHRRGQWHLQVPFEVRPDVNEDAERFVAKDVNKLLHRATTSSPFIPSSDLQRLTNL
jgi:hypothetical protein